MLSREQIMPSHKYLNKLAARGELDKLSIVLDKHKDIWKTNFDGSCFLSYLPSDLEATEELANFYQKHNINPDWQVLQNMIKEYGHTLGLGSFMKVGNVLGVGGLVEIPIQTLDDGTQAMVSIPTEGMEIDEGLTLLESQLRAFLESNNSPYFAQILRAVEATREVFRPDDPQAQLDEWITSRMQNKFRDLFNENTQRQDIEDFIQNLDEKIKEKIKILNSLYEEKDENFVQITALSKRIEALDKRFLKVTMFYDKLSKIKFLPIDGKLKILAAKAQQGELVILPFRTQSHGLGCAMLDKKLLYTDRFVSNPLAKKSSLSRIFSQKNDLSDEDFEKLIDDSFVQVFSSVKKIKATLESAFDLKHTQEKLGDRAQLHGTCIYTNMRSNIEPILLAMGDENARADYRQFVAFVRQNAINQLLDIIQDENFPDDQRQVAIQLAQQYLFSKIGMANRLLHPMKSASNIHSDAHWKNIKRVFKVLENTDNLVPIEVKRPRLVKRIRNRMDREASQLDGAIHDPQGPKSQAIVFNKGNRNSFFKNHQGETPIYDMELPLDRLNPN